ncbi:MAG: hypothetical protein AAF740_05745 [Bacteroidota bacterium]
MESTKRSFWGRLKMGIALLVVFLLVYATNRIDQSHFEEVQKALNSVYEDRLVAKAAVYDLSNLFHQKHLQLLKSQESFKLDADFYTRVDARITEFTNTKFTNREADVFKIFQKDYEDSKGLAQKIDLSASAEVELLESKLTRIQEDLDELAKIQVSEGDRLRKTAQDSLDKNIFSSKVEFVFLLIIGLLLQAVIFYT